jgi:hypothetical protein
MKKLTDIVNKILVQCNADLDEDMNTGVAGKAITDIFIRAVKDHVDVASLSQKRARNLREALLYRCINPGYNILLTQLCSTHIDDKMTEIKKHMKNEMENELFLEKIGEKLSPSEFKRLKSMIAG